MSDMLRKTHSSFNSQYRNNLQTIGRAHKVNLQEAKNIQLMKKPVNSTNALIVLFIYGARGLVHKIVHG